MQDVYFIGVDIGSQSTKVYIFNEKGEVVTFASESLKPMISRKLGYVEHPDDDLWDSFKVVMKKVMNNFKGEKEHIKGLGLCSIRCCRVFMKEDGTLFEPVMSWMDVRSYETFKDNDNIAYTSPTSGYLTHRLTGEFKDTVSNAFQWQFPVDLDTWSWSEDEEYFEKFNIPHEKLLKLFMPGTILGYVTKEASESTLLPYGLPVVATANDKAVEALGSGLIDNKDALFSLGTYIASMVYSEENSEEPKNYWVNLSSIPNRYLNESNGIRRGMWHISWYKSIIGEEYEKRAKELGLSMEECLEKEALKVPAGSSGLLTIPDWLAPANELYRKGVMIGFDERHTRGHIYRSILEGIAFTLTNNYEDMIEELKIKPERIIISGGGSNSDLFMQIFADMTGQKTVRTKINGAAALGSAICVAVATGVYEGFEEAVENMVKIKNEFIPNPENTKLYKEINEGVFKNLPKLLKDSLVQIHKTCEQL